MEYRVVEVKWSRTGRFIGAPPITNDQTEFTEILNGFVAEGWGVFDITHDIGDGLRFSIVTLGRP